MNGNKGDDAASAGPAKISYSVEEAAEATGIGRSHLYIAIKTGELASLKLGKRRLLMREDILAWLKRQRTAA